MHYKPPYVRRVLYTRSIRFLLTFVYSWAMISLCDRLCRPIRAWLEGLCQPQHPEFWKGRSTAWRVADRRSVFHNPLEDDDTSEEQACQAAEETLQGTGDLAT